MMTLYTLHAKIGPNKWIRLSELSKSLSELDKEYTLREDADKAKGYAKNYLKAHEPANKVPLRIQSRIID
ncbi:hypothetical protein [Methylomonas sp. AM2-LC]|uniref:hypothetical protein n=1 Tax=Methylomonas sp. AM2-LC TaxID=3153301 RepID=UPI003266E265